MLLKIVQVYPLQVHFGCSGSALPCASCPHGTLGSCLLYANEVFIMDLNWIELYVESYLGFVLAKWLHVQQ